MPTTPRNTAAYVRLSVATEESVSVAGQVRMILAETERRGWPVPTIFTDENVSGSKDIARPARDDLERRIALGEFDAVLVKSVDRLARSVLDFHRIAATAAKRGCALVIIEAGLDTSTPSGKMMLGILAEFAAFEAATIAARVTAANVGIRSAGRTRGGPVAYGQRNVTREGFPGMYREADPEEAAVIVRMVEELLAGHSLRFIAAGLNRDGIPTPRAADAVLAGREADADRGGWAYKAVTRVLSNPAIAGQERALGDVIRDADGLPRVNAEAAIIDAETFKRVQEILGARSEGDTRRTPLAERPLLDGIARCAYCRRPLRRSSSRNYISYKCVAADQARCPSSTTTISAPLLDSFVVAEFLSALGDTPRTRVEQIEDGRLSARLAEVRAEVSDTAAAFATAAASEIPTLAARLTALREAEARLLAEVGAAPVLAVVNTGKTWGETFAEAEGDITARRDLLAEALGSVVVSKPPTPTGAPSKARSGRNAARTSERVEILWGGEHEAASA